MYRIARTILTIFLSCLALDLCGADQYEFDLFHVQERMYNLKRGTVTTFTMNYTKDARIVRGLSAASAFLGVSLLMAYPQSYVALKAIASGITTGIACGMIYYRGYMRSKWTKKPQADSYEASFAYGIKHYFLKPFIITIPIAFTAAFMLAKYYPSGV